MRPFREFLTERYINLIHDKSEKEKYAKEVWDILQYSYKDIGGIKGSGFESVQSMVDNIPFWKLARVNGKIVAAILYKDTGGRKIVALGTDGSKEGISKVSDIIKSEVNRSFGEKSKGTLGLIMKSIPWEILEQYVLTPEQAQKAIKKDVTAVSSVKDSEIPEDGIKTLSRYPQLRKYAYLREIGGKPTFKVAIGVTGLGIF